MPIPFRDADSVDALGAAGFLGFVRDGTGGGIAGGVLLVDARGAPLELVHHWTTLPAGPLWSPEDAWRFTARRLAADLFRALRRTPDLLLVADEPATPASWLDDLEIEIPTGILPQSRSVGVPASIRWAQWAPELLTPNRLYDQLHARGMVGEPFARLTRALHDLHPSLPRNPDA